MSEQGIAGRSIKHCLFHYDYVIALLFIGGGLLWSMVVGGDFGWRMLIACFSAGTAFYYFVQKQKLDEIRLTKELFTEFNHRYDGLNDRLNAIIREQDHRKKLAPCERNTLYDYFNLCAEEHLFHTLGYIHPKIWSAWEAGMKDYGQNPRICLLWEEEEKKSKSYYGFTFPKKKSEECRRGEHRL